MSYQNYYSRLLDQIKAETEDLLSRFSYRIEEVKANAESVMKIIRFLDEEKALSEALKYFGPGEHRAFGVDGSMDQDERLETLIFYVNAAAYSCPFYVSEKEVKVEVRKAQKVDKLSAYAAVPLWLEDLTDLYGPEAAELDLDFQASIEKIPYSMMTIAELWTAYKILKENKNSLVFLDRPLSGTFATSLKDLRQLLSAEPMLTSLSGEKGSPSKLDLALASVLGSGSAPVPKRFPYATYIAVKELIEKDEASIDELAEAAGVKGKESQLKNSLINLNKRYGDQLLEGLVGQSVRIKQEVKGYWDRVKGAVEAFAKRAFEGKEHPLKVGEDKLLTAYDLSAINVYLLYMIYDEARKNKNLVVGITKDTTASEFSRSVIPFYLGEEKIFKLKNDKSLLTILSAVHYSMIKTPWRTLSYDYGFSYLAKAEKGFVAAKKSIGRTGLFVKSYFQLRTFAKDPTLRSPVFAYDRFFDEAYDSGREAEVKVSVKGKEKEVRVYFEREENPLDNMILKLLSISDNPEVLEAYGHNQLLFLADKAVKHEVSLIKSSIRKIADFKLESFARREKIFMISRRFRDIRSESERMRQESAKGVEGYESV